jgi:hypothetical protein
MSIKHLKYPACVAIVLALACCAAYAQSAPKSIHSAPSLISQNIPAPAPPAGTPPIFSNLGPTATNDYNDGNGIYVLGKTSSTGDPEQWVAVPFTATKASHATQIAAAIGVLNSGSNGAFTLGLYSDNGANGVGTLLASGNAKATAVFGTCCTLTKVKFAGAGIALTAKTQYWVVASANDTTNPGLSAAWAVSNTYNYGLDSPGSSSGWLTLSLDDPAVEVLGTVP